MNGFLSFVSDERWALHRPLMDELRLQLHEAAGQPADADKTGCYYDGRSDDSSLSIIDRGVAIIPVHGLITKRGLRYWSNVVSTDRIKAELDVLGERDDIHTVVGDFDTGGGTVSGTCNLADAWFEFRQKKRTIGVINESAYSAGIWLCAASEEVVISRNGGAGSIGVYTLHYNWTKWEEEIGIKKTVIHAGKYKAIHERELTDELKEHVQAEIDTDYSIFVDSIAQFRNTTSQAVLDNMADARIFIGRQAVDAGLADRIGTLDQVVDEAIKQNQHHSPLHALGENAHVQTRNHYRFATRIVRR